MQTAHNLFDRHPIIPFVIFLVLIFMIVMRQRAKRGALPDAYSAALIVGVGNTHRGIYIDEHSSRQDDAALKRLASQLSGSYYDANAKHLPSEAVSAVAISLPEGDDTPVALRDVALALAHERLGMRPRSAPNRRFLHRAEAIAA